MVLRRLLVVSWCLTCQTFITALFISLLYWTLLYGGDGGLSYVNFFVHASQVFFWILGCFTHLRIVHHTDGPARMNHLRNCPL